jgi:hypothetical protein
MIKLNKIGPCKVQRKFGNNAYELKLLEDVGISPIFNVSDQYPYGEDEIERSEDQEKI